MIPQGWFSLSVEGLLLAGFTRTRQHQQLALSRLGTASYRLDSD
jgi:hypothetical protein